MRRVGAGALAVALAATIAACGDDKSTGSASGTTAVETTAAQTGTTGSDPGGETGTGTTATGTPSDEPNGVEEQSADEIVADAKAAAKAATSVHVAGAAEGVVVDISLVRWEGASGRIEQGPNRFDLIVVGKAIFLRGDDDFYRSLGGESVRQLLTGKWMKVPPGGRGFESFDAFTDMDRFLDEVLDPDGASIEKGDVETIDGIEAVAVTDPGRGTLYVATRGEPLPVKFVDDENARPRGEVVFDRWNEPVELRAPAEAIDIEELQGVRTG